MLSTYSGDDHLSNEYEDVDEHEEGMVPAPSSFEPDVYLVTLLPLPVKILMLKAWIDLMIIYPDIMAVDIMVQLPMH